MIQDVYLVLTYVKNKGGKKTKCKDRAQKEVWAEGAAIKIKKSGILQ